MANFVTEAFNAITGSTKETKTASSQTGDPAATTGMSNTTKVIIVVVVVVVVVGVVIWISNSGNKDKKEAA